MKHLAVFVLILLLFYIIHFINGPETWKKFAWYIPGALAIMCFIVAELVYWCIYILSI